MPVLPRFYFRKCRSDDAAVLSEGEGFLVTRNSGAVTLECFGRWRPEFQEIYGRYGATGASISSTVSWDGCSLGFLQRLPNLRDLQLEVDVPLDITVIGALGGLRRLALSWRVSESPEMIEFHRLSRLRECSVSWHPAFATAFRLSSLSVLGIRDARRLSELDLTGLPRLAELELTSCPALGRVDLNRNAQLVALEVVNCGKFRPNWAQFASYLRYLRLGGRIGFELEELAEARELRFLWAELSGKRSWEILRYLPLLEGIRLIDLKVTKEVAELVQSINEAKGHGRTLCARPPEFILADR